jgi:hypothetical protein
MDKVQEIKQALKRYDDADDTEEMSRASYVISLESYGWLSYLLTELEQEQAAHKITNDFFENLITRSNEIKESLLTELNAVKAEAERQKQIRYNATEANTINHSRQAEQIESLHQQLDAAKQLNQVYMDEINTLRALLDAKE